MLWWMKCLPKSLLNAMVVFLVLAGAIVSEVGCNAEEQLEVEVLTTATNIPTATPKPAQLQKAEQLEAEAAAPPKNIPKATPNPAQLQKVVCDSESLYKPATPAKPTEAAAPQPQMQAPRTNGAPLTLPTALPEHVSKLGRIDNY